MFLELEGLELAHIFDNGADSMFVDFRLPGHFSHGAVKISAISLTLAVRDLQILGRSLVPLDSLKRLIASDTICFGTRSNRTIST